MPVFEVIGSDRVYVSKEDIALLARNAAKNGFIIGEINTYEEYCNALALAIPEKVLNTLNDIGQDQELPATPADRPDGIER